MLDCKTKETFFSLEINEEQLHKSYSRGETIKNKKKLKNHGVSDQKKKQNFHQLLIYIEPFRLKKKRMKWNETYKQITTNHITFSPPVFPQSTQEPRGKKKNFFFFFVSLRSLEKLR